MMDVETCVRVCVHNEHVYILARRCPIIATNQVSLILVDQNAGNFQNKHC